MCARDNSYSWCEEETQSDTTDTGDSNSGSGTGTEDVNTGSNGSNTTSDQNITVEPCEIACDGDKECSDANTYTIDVCNKDGTCESYCINLPIA